MNSLQGTTGACPVCTDSPRALGPSAAGTGGMVGWPAVASPSIIHVIGRQPSHLQPPEVQWRIRPCCKRLFEQTKEQKHL